MEQHFVLLGRREIGLSPVKTNELIAKHVQMGQYKTRTVVRGLQRYLFHRYARQFDFITKTKTVILFANRT